MIDGMVIIILIVLYYIIKWAVKNGINESIIGKYYLDKEEGMGNYEIIKNDEKLN